MASTTESELKSKLKYRAVLKSVTRLVEFIDESDPVKLALRLLQEGLLNENTYEELLMESKTGTDKARRIVNELLKKVKVNSDERYEKLIEVLNEEEMFDAVKLIKERYKGKCIHLFKDFQSNNITTCDDIRLAHCIKQSVCSTPNS